MPTDSAFHSAFATTSRGLERDAPPMRLFEKAKRYGIWNPSEIDFTQDKRDWAGLTDLERTLLLHLTALFQAGEEAVTGDILPLMLAISAEGRLEESLFLTTFLFEEAKHTDFFRRFLDEVASGELNLARFHGENYRALVYTALPAAMNRLLRDSSPAAQVRAAVTYNMIVEGVLAETGYHAYLSALERNGLLPGQCKGVRLLKQDESRHIAYGIYLITRHVAADPHLWEVAEETLNELLPYALGVVGDTFATYPVMPFGLVEADFIDFALAQFNKRLARIEAARSACDQPLDALLASAAEEDG